MIEIETKEKNEPNNQEATLSLLKASLLETQHTIRSYDTKAQICAIGYLFSLNLVIGINKILWPDTAAGIEVVLYGWGVLIFPIFLFGYVIYPSRRSVYPPDYSGSLPAERVLYVRQDRHKNVDELLESANRADQTREFAYELFQTSELRSRKRTRFIRALGSAVISLFIMFIVHLYAVISI